MVPGTADGDGAGAASALGRPVGGTARLPPPVRTSTMTAVIRPIAARTVSHRPGGKRKSLLGPWPITSNCHTRSAQTPTSACNYPAALGQGHGVVVHGGCPEGKRGDTGSGHAGWGASR